MIWALLFAIIFGSGNEVFFLPKLEKYVKKHIDDKELVEEFKQVRNDSKKARKKFSKLNSRTLKQIQKLNKSYHSKESEFLELGGLLLTERKNLQKQDIEEMMKIKASLTEEQWKCIVEATLEDIDKQSRKNKKQLESLQKKIKKVEHAVLKKLPKNDNTELFYQQLTNYLQDIMAASTEYYKFQEKEENIVLSYQSTTADIEALALTMNQHRKRIYKGYVETHFRLIEVTTEREFKAIIQQLNRII